MNSLFLNLYIKFQILMDREDGQDMVEYAPVSYTHLKVTLPAPHNQPYAKTT